MTKVECSLCGQPFDEDAEVQKERHKDKHDAKIKTASSNRDTRKLEWVPIGTKKPMYEYMDATEDDWHIKNRNYKPDGTLSKMQGFPISLMKIRSDALRLQVEIESEIEKEIAGEFNEDDRDRVPAGQPNGGQWVKGSGSGSSSSDDSSSKKETKKQRERKFHNEIIDNIRKDLDKQGLDNHGLFGKLVIEDGDSENIGQLKMAKLDHLIYDESHFDSREEWIKKQGEIKRNMRKYNTKVKGERLLKNIDEVIDKKLERAIGMQAHDIKPEQIERIEEHFEANRKVLTKSKFKEELAIILDKFDDMQQDIADNRAQCEYNKNSDTFTVDDYPSEMVCGASSGTVWEKLVTDIGHVSNMYNGEYDDTGQTHRRYMGDLDKIGHAWLQLDDGTIVDPSYGQMYLPNVKINSDLRLRFISPDEPEYEKYDPRYRTYPFRYGYDRRKRLDETNDFGKDLPRSTYITTDDLKNIMEGKQHGPDKFNITMGGSDKDKDKIKKNLLKSHKKWDEWEDELFDEFEQIEKSNTKEVGNQVAKSKIIGSDITKMKFLEPETRLAKQRMNDSQIGFKKYLNDISWS